MRAGIVRMRQPRIARLAKKDHAVELDHHVSGQRRRQRDHGRCHRHQHVDVIVGQARRQQEGLQQQPFRHEAVERRQAGDGQHTHQHQPRDAHGMRWISPPSRPMLRSPVACRIEPVPTNSRLLKKAWLRLWYSVAVSASAASVSLPYDVEDQGETDADQQQADVLDRRIGQQALHVSLHGGEHHAEHCSDQPQRQRQHAPPPQLQRAAGRSVTRRMP